MIASQSRVRQSVCEMKEQETKRKSPEEQKTLNTPGAVCKKNFPNHVFIESLQLRGFQEYKNYLGQFLSMGLFQGHIYIWQLKLKRGVGEDTNCSPGQFAMNNDNL